MLVEPGTSHEVGGLDRIAAGRPYSHRGFRRLQLRHRRAALACGCLLPELDAETDTKRGGAV